MTRPDLAVSKLAAGREKDLAFVAAMLRRRLVSRHQIEGVFAELAGAHVQTSRVRLARCQPAGQA